MTCPPQARSAWVAAVLALSVLTPRLAAAQAEAENLSASFRKAARHVLPAVVTVRAVGVPPIAAGPIPFVQVGPPPRNVGASGLVIDAAKGFVLTNDHVVDPTPFPQPLNHRAGPPPLPGRLIVTLPDGRERPVQDVRRDPRSDLALLTIDPQGLHQADWGDSETLDTGDWVLAVGQPFGLSNTVTAGIVSGKGRGLGLGQYEDLIQTDAAINPGNSGGPLVNLKGEVVGINVAIRSLNGGYDGVGFAVPATRARRVAADLAEFGRVRRSYLGVRIGRLDPEDAERLGRADAVPITAVVEGAPASAAGLRPGDIIVALNGKAVGGTGALQSAIESAPIGEPLALTVWREGQELEVRVRPDAQPDTLPSSAPEPIIVPAPLPPTAPGAPAPGEPLLEPIAPESREQPEARSPTRFPDIGLRLAEPTPALIRRYDLDPGTTGLVVVGVEPDGPADRAGVELGMLLTDAADRKVSTLSEFRTSLARRRDGADLVLRVVKGGKPGFRVLLGRAEARTPETPLPVPDDPLIPRS